MERIGVRVAATATVALAFAGTASAHSTYQVRWGDTLTGIAAAHGTSVSALAQANGLDPSRILLAGTVIQLSGGGPVSRGSHVVRRGETLSGIAARYGTSVRALARANGLSPRRFLLAGSALRIPSLRAAAVSAPSATAGQWSAQASIDAWAARYGVDPRLARALAWMESGYQPEITSSADAWGVMQVTPSAWSYVETVLLGEAVPRTADGNVRIGVAYLAHLLRAFGGDERLALAAYYQGERAVREHGVYPESERYVEDVLALRSRV